ncbi:MAG: Asp-tRNA(Asn)/Glu-tRNA(Gln) amidotransferase subunit GatA, partial [Saprospiraceae bacterium]|nr:Asp-tRNA(Asn)/Glu-tRNA(Gln) amidotransferase subunit GatA [Saprospiraceae bacterium]
KAAGHAVELIDFPYLDYLIPAYYVLTTAEASSNLSRYDGVRYGYRSREAQTVEEVYRLSRTEGFGREVKRRILLGAFVLSAGYYDAYYARAQKIRRLIRDEFGRLLNDYDQVLLPASPTPPWRIGELADDPVAMYLSDIYTVPANLAGLPAVSIPVGRHEPTQLPVGLQLLGRPFEEALLLSSARNLLQLFTL